MFLIKSLTTPIVWILTVLLLGLILIRFSRRRIVSRIGRCFLLLGMLMLFTCSFPPVANILTYSLESRYPPPATKVLATLDIIVVLGGGGYPSGGFRGEAELAGRSYPRLYHGVRVFHEGHAGLLAFCGGPLQEGKEAEAPVMRAMAIRLGVPEDKVLTETVSSDTMQNAKGLVDLLPKEQGRRIGLVTSATHMLRSEQVFRSQFPHDTIVPVPVHYQYDPAVWRIGNLKPSVEALEQTTGAIHEWIGILWYSLRYR